MRQSVMFVLEARELLSAGRLQQVVEVCKRGLACYPEHVSGYLYLSQAYVGLGQTGRAVNVLRDGFRRTRAQKLDRLRRELAGEPALAKSAVLDEGEPSGEMIEPDDEPAEIVPERAAVIPGGFHQEVPATVPEPLKSSAPKPLQLHTVQSESRLRSSNLRLIPGLEFAPLRQNAPDSRQQIGRLIEDTGAVKEGQPQALREKMPESPVPDPVVREPRSPLHRASIVTSSPSDSEHLTPLEELARRLENARIPIVEEQEQHTSFNSPIVSETLADILVAQGAYAEAINAFQTLERTRPARSDHYREKIKSIEEKMSGNTSGNQQSTADEP